MSNRNSGEFFSFSVTPEGLKKAAINVTKMVTAAVITSGCLPPKNTSAEVNRINAQGTQNAISAPLSAGTQIDLTPYSGATLQATKAPDQNTGPDPKNPDLLGAGGAFTPEQWNIINKPETMSKITDMGTWVDYWTSNEAGISGTRLFLKDSIIGYLDKDPRNRFVYIWGPDGTAVPTIQVQFGPDDIRTFVPPNGDYAVKPPAKKGSIEKKYGWTEISPGDGNDFSWDSTNKNIQIVTLADRKKVVAKMDKTTGQWNPPQVRTPRVEQQQQPTPDKVVTDPPKSEGFNIVGVDSLSMIDLNQTTKEDFIVVPDNANEYVLGMKVSADTKTDGVKMVVGDKEIDAIHVSTLPDGSKVAFYSIPRGTKALKIKTADGKEGDVSQLLPGQEPENKIFDVKHGYSFEYFGSKETIFQALRANSVDYVEYKGAPKKSLPDPGENSTYLVFSLKQAGLDKTTMTSRKDGFRVLTRDTNGKLTLVKPTKSGFGWGVNAQVCDFFFNVPNSQTEFDIYIPGFGVIHIKSQF